MSLNIYSCMLFLCAYLPFEDFILLSVKLPDALYFALRSFVELALYGLLIVVIYEKVRHHRRLVRTPIDYLLLLFLALSLLSLFLSRGNVFGGLVNLRSFLRYFAAYYIAVNIRISDHDAIRFLKLLVVLSLFQVVLMTGQYFVSPINDYFINMRESFSVDMGGVEKKLTEEKTGAALGTFAQAMNAVSILLIAFVFLVTQRLVYGFKIYHRVFYYASVLGIAIAVFFTYKRSGLLFFIFSFLLASWILSAKHFRRRILMYTIAGAFGAIALIGFGDKYSGNEDLSASAIRGGSFSLGSFMAELFTSEYWTKISENSRGWVIINVGGSVLSSFRIIGYGPDEDTAKQALVDENPAISRLIEYSPLEDVYWVAMLLYYGPVGVGIMMVILYKLYLAATSLVARSIVPIETFIGGTCAVMVVVAFFYAFIERVFELRIFSFYFWFLMGIGINFIRRK